MTREEFITNVKESQRQLRLFLLGLCGDEQLADDLAQEALLKAYLASPGHIAPSGDIAPSGGIGSSGHIAPSGGIGSSGDRRRSKFSTWLLKIAYNCFLDNRKLYYERKRNPLETAKGILDGDTADRAFKYQQLYLALDSLVEKERCAVMLHYIYGLSVKEMASIMDESVPAAKKQLQRARTHLKTKLEEYETRSE